MIILYVYSSVDHSSTDDEFMRDQCAHVKDMEAGAIAWVLENYSRELVSHLPSTTADSSEITSVDINRNINELTVDGISIANKDTNINNNVISSTNANSSNLPVSASINSCSSSCSATSITVTAVNNIIPFFALKVVTDIVDGDKPTQDEFIQNLHTASNVLSDTLIKVLQFLPHKRLIDL